MGSKNLKAIVVKGTGAVRIGDSKRFKEAVEKARGMLKKSKTLEKMRKYGTLGGLAKTGNLRSFV